MEKSNSKRYNKFIYHYWQAFDIWYLNLMKNQKYTKLLLLFIYQQKMM